MPRALAHTNTSAIVAASDVLTPVVEKMAVTNRNSSAWLTRTSSMTMTPPTLSLRHHKGERRYFRFTGYVFVPPKR